MVNWFIRVKEIKLLKNIDKAPDPRIEEQWAAWQKENPPEKSIKIDTAELKSRLIKDLTFSSSLSVEEYTLFQKWSEIHEKYPVLGKNLSGKKYISGAQQKLINHVKNNIWTPKDPMDFMNLEPEFFSTDGYDTGIDGVEGPELWNTIRTFSSTMKNNNNIGRNLNFICKDKVSGKYLGVVCISSDFLDLTPRDSYIGWDRKIKTSGRMINHTAIGSTIVPLQPLGYNYVGGKLLALLCLSDTVQNMWKKQYGDILVGVTTTSLYGSFSQYQNLQHWKKRGHSSGSVSYDPTKDTVKMLRAWIKHEHPRKYFEWYSATNPAGQPYKRDHKNRSQYFVYSKLGIPKELIKSDHQRGIYFSTLYDNSCDFLRKDITEDKLVKSFDTKTETLVKVWKEKYATKRITGLLADNRQTSESLFYDDLIFLDFEEAKEKYLKQVGR